MTVRARQIKVEAYALAGAARDPRVPWAARLFAAIAIGYTLSPIDLIPDFIPLIGYLDDLLLVPLFILIARRLIPPDILAEHRQRARSDNHDRSSRAAAVVIVSIWVIVLLVVFVLLWRRLG
ncbi:MAG TPA: YkvA family protein [Nitrolancea sp.]|nr:YkvA family protein [Nitrolancea sp.]